LREGIRGIHEIDIAIDQEGIPDETKDAVTMTCALEIERYHIPISCMY
jgi:hypothetical protein